MPYGSSNFSKATNFPGSPTTSRVKAISDTSTTSKIPELDGRYSIFGKIIKGLDVLKKINKEDYIEAVQISN